MKRAIKIKPRTTKLYYFAVENPEGKVRVELGETKFHAIAISVPKDNYKWSNADYKANKLK